MNLNCEKQNTVYDDILLFIQKEISDHDNKA